MIKKWSNFIIESNQEQLTEEMAQEIIFYFSENSRVDKELENIFYAIAADNYVMYETGYGEMKEYIKKLLDKAKSHEQDNIILIDLYHKIREVMKDFPTVSEIEDVFLDLIEVDKLNFNYSHVRDRECTIKLYSWPQKFMLGDFIDLCKQINNRLGQLYRNTYEVKLEKCEYYHNSVNFEIDLVSNRFKNVQDDDW